MITETMLRLKSAWPTVERLPVDQRLTPAEREALELLFTAFSEQSMRILELRSIAADSLGGTITRDRTMARLEALHAAEIAVLQAARCET